MTRLSPSMDRFLHGKNDKVHEDGQAIQRRWRADVSGVPVIVCSEEAARHLVGVNHRLARMELALRKIARLGAMQSDIAREALKNV